MCVQKQLNLVLLDLYASHFIQREVASTLRGCFQGWNIWAVIFSSVLSDFFCKAPQRGKCYYSVWILPLHFWWVKCTTPRLGICYSHSTRTVCVHEHWTVLINVFHLSSEAWSQQDCLNVLCHRCHKPCAPGWGAVTGQTCLSIQLYSSDFSSKVFSIFSVSSTCCKIWERRCRYRNSLCLDIIRECGNISVCVFIGKTIDISLSMHAYAVPGAVDNQLSWDLPFQIQTSDSKETLSCWTFYGQWELFLCEFPSVWFCAAYFT